MTNDEFFDFLKEVKRREGFTISSLGDIRSNKYDHCPIISVAHLIAGESDAGACGCPLESGYAWEWGTEIGLDDKTMGNLIAAADGLEVDRQYSKWRTRLLEVCGLEETWVDEGIEHDKAGIS
jgi:hypothetical protein